MTLVYKIHPGIGIARVGRSAADPFIASDAPDADPVERDGSPFAGYKGPDRLVRRQAVRFRVLEYDRDAGGNERFVREVDGASARIRWTVRLGAAKAAGPVMVGRRRPDGARVVLPDFSRPRNAPPPGMSRADLIARVDYQLSGPDDRPAVVQGSIAGIPVMIGEAWTDSAGNLVVASGTGEARSWTTPPIGTEDFLNNPTWFDDISDGPIDAVVEFSDGRRETAAGAWVVAAPPDFAPHIHGVVTLHDVIADATGAVPAAIFFDDDILPLLQRGAALRWTNGLSLWGVLATHVADQRLRDPSPSSAAVRKTAAEDLRKVQLTLEDFRYTASQLRAIAALEAGMFTPGADPGRSAPDLGRSLDAAALLPTVGAGFFPGIEIGALATLADGFSEPFRLKRTSFQDHDLQRRTLEPGSVSQRMACPWQADFLECQGNWWPAQRPDIVRVLETGQEVNLPWTRGVETGDTNADHELMVAHFAQLGVLVRRAIGGTQKMVETGRHPDL